MFNIIIFLLGAGIMFFMALRSVLARRRLCTQGQKVTATVEGTVQSRDGGAYVLAFTTAGGATKAPVGLLLVRGSQPVGMSTVDAGGILQ